MTGDTSALNSLRAPERAVAPTRGERIPALASQVVGGPLGKRAVIGARGWHAAAAVLSSLSSVLVALGVLQKNHCVSAGWATPGSLWRACYSDLPVAVATSGGSSPWAHPAIGSQPPLTAIVTWVVRMLVPDGSQLRLQQGMFAWGAAIVAAVMALAVCLVAATLPRGPWVAAHVALSPVLVTVALVSFDALGVMLVAAGLFAWHRGRYLLGGVALAAALLVRPTLGVVLVACLLVAARRCRWSDVRELAFGALAAICIVLGVAAAWGGNPFASFQVWHAQPASYGSIWYVLGFAGINFSATALTVIAFLGWVGAIVLGWFLTRTEATIEPEPVAVLMLVMVMVTSRAVPVQAALWLLPLLALCAVKWRDHLIWAAVELTYFALVWGFVARDSNIAKAMSPGWYAALVIARVLAWFYVARAALVAAGDLEHRSSTRTEEVPVSRAAETVRGSTSAAPQN